MTNTGEMPIATSPGWQASLRRAIRDPNRLIDQLQLGDEFREPARIAAGLFPLRVPESYLRRMRIGDPCDPLLRQVSPIGAEAELVPGFTTDALSEKEAHFAPGVLQKYSGRALLITTGSCAIHCRYCFRRHYPYGEEPRRLEEWESAFEAIARDESIHEALLSGGDPLMLTDVRLTEICGRLDAIGHLRRLRIHTRLPIVLPDRVTAELLEMFRSLRAKVIVVVHANHPHELVGDCAAALTRLVRAGVTTFNQAVLLHGVNDSSDVQVELCERLIDLGVIPYYLHQLDRVTGTAHFEVPIETGRAIMEDLRRRLPGYAVPRYVQEVPGEPYKVPL